MRTAFFTGLLLFAAGFACAQGHFNLTEVKKIEFDNIKFSPDGSYFASGYMNDIVIWNRTEAGYVQGKNITGFSPEKAYVRMVAISNDGNLICGKMDDDRLHVFRRTTEGFKKIATLTDFERDPNWVSFSADNTYLAGSQGQVDDEWSTVIWKIAGDAVTKVNVFKMDRKLRFDPGDAGLACMDEQIYRFKEGKLSDPQEMKTLNDYNLDWNADCAFSPEGKYFASIQGNDLCLWKRGSEGFKPTHTLSSKREWKSRFVEFSPDSRYVVVTNEDFREGKKRLLVYQLDGDTLVPEAEIGQYEKDIYDFHFSADGKYAIAEFDGFTSIIYKVEGVKPGPYFKAKPVVIASNTTNTPVKQDVKTTTVVKPVNNVPANNIVNIFWINPNPEALNDKPVVAEKSTIEIQVKVVSNKKVTQEDIKIIINGKEMEKNKFSEVSLKEAAQDNLFEYTYSNAIPLEITSDNINTIEVIAAGKKSSKALKVLYSAAKPNLHVLAIGTSLDLQFPKKDAQDFANLFSTQGGSEKDKLFGNVDVRTLIGKDATTNAIKESIEKFRYDFKTGAIGPRDVMLIFISSHGFIYQDKFRIQGDDYRDIFKETYSVAYEEITSRLNEVPCKKLIFLDACFSGGAKANIADINNAIRDLNNQTQGVTTFSSSSNDEYSYEDEKWQNGAFTYSIKEALKDGKADKDKNGIITIGELFEYVSGRVPQIVTEVKSKSQHPTMPVNELKNLGVFVVGK